MPKDPFHVFISWSKEPSKKIAEYLLDFLGKVFPDEMSVSFYISTQDVSYGTHFRPELEDALAKSSFGLFVLTDNNFNESWLMFEAGAIAIVENSKVVPIFFNREANNIESPLDGRGSIKFNKEDFKELFYRLQKDISGYPEGRKLNSNFKNQISTNIENNWEDFEKKVIDEIDIYMKQSPVSIDAKLEPGAGIFYITREEFLDNLLNELPNDKSDRIIFFGGISTKLRDEVSLSKLANWVNVKQKKLFICYESEEIARKRLENIDSKDINIDRKTTHIVEMKEKLFKKIGEEHHRLVHFIDFKRETVVYAIVHGQNVFFSPTIHMRSSNVANYAGSTLEMIAYIKNIIEHNNEKKQRVDSERELLLELNIIEKEIKGEKNEE